MPAARVSATACACHGHARSAGPDPAAAQPVSPREEPSTVQPGASQFPAAAQWAARTEPDASLAQPTPHRPRRDQTDRCGWVRSTVAGVRLSLSQRLRH